jgi:anti-sigma B factor antagonist
LGQVGVFGADRFVAAENIATNHKEERTMELRSRTVNAVTVLDVSGRFDAHTAADVAAVLEKAARGTPAKIVVNLGGVSFMDSTALATLVQGMKRCRQARGDLRLCNLQQPVRIIFELTRLDKAFDIYSNEAEALA